MDIILLFLFGAIVLLLPIMILVVVWEIYSDIRQEKADMKKRYMEKHIGINY